MLERSERDALHPSVDETVLRRIDDASRTVDSPYADVETLARKVESVSEFLVDVARERALTDYGTVASECGVHASAWNECWSCSASTKPPTTGR